MFLILLISKENKNMKNKKNVSNNTKILVEKNNHVSELPMIGSMNFMPSGFPQKKYYKNSNFSKTKNISHFYGKYQPFIKYIPS